jgi:hypothetical protein
MVPASSRTWRSSALDGACSIPKAASSAAASSGGTLAGSVGTGDHGWSALSLPPPAAGEGSDFSLMSHTSESSAAARSVAAGASGSTVGSSGAPAGPALGEQTPLRQASAGRSGAPGSQRSVGSGVTSVYPSPLSMRCASPRMRCGAPRNCRLRSPLGAQPTLPAESRTCAAGCGHPCRDCGGA